MQKTTDGRKKTAPILWAAVIILLLGMLLAFFLFPLIGEVAGELLAIGILVFYCLIIVGTIVGILLALRQRLKEIESGEEEDAKQY